ncbi:MAG: hypothetical protein AAGG68_19370 [Bacteroidota bacterium]
MLTPLIVPRYIARVESYVFEDIEPSSEVEIMYLDIAVIRSKIEEPFTAYEIAPPPPIFEQEEITWIQSLTKQN